MAHSRLDLAGYGLFESLGRTVMTGEIQECLEPIHNLRRLWVVPGDYEIDDLGKADHTGFLIGDET